MDYQSYKNTLTCAGVKFAPGLTQSEIQQLEDEYEFIFPPDLREFLMFALPISDGFINWRDEEKNEILRLLSCPLEEIYFDIEHAGFWLEEWGPKPELLSDACAIAKIAIDQAPTLIPINGHRYIPDRPHERNNPIFSVHQTDIIYYGQTLPHYLENEFSTSFGTTGDLKGMRYEEFKTIEFWSYLVEDYPGTLVS